MGPGYLSFFSGALGLDLGLEQAGWRCLAANELDRHACATIRANRPGLPLLARDVRELSAGDFAPFVRGPLFAVVGGPPCQAFSTAGRRQGLSDERGNVFLHFIDLATALAPRTIVVENVRGLLSAAVSHRPHLQRGVGHPGLGEDELPGGALRRILAKLEAAGYAASFQLYNVAKFGVPQSRERLVLIARAGGPPVPHLVPTHGGPGQPEWRTFRSAVEGLTDVGACARFRPGREEFFALLRAGENWRDLPEEMQRRALGGAFGSSGGRVGFCRRVAWDKPAPTLVTSPTMPATELGHPSELRPLSIGEYKRLQTFPDDWSFGGPLGSQYRQIGNAVPVEFGRRIGEHILAFEKGALVMGGRSSRVSRYRRTDEATWLERGARA